MVVPIVKTLGLIKYNNYLLLEHFNGFHAKGEGDFYRPIGGRIEFGETSQDALHREFWEEMYVTIEVKNYIQCVENIFTIGEEIGHEIIQVYEVSFKDYNLYQQKEFLVKEGEKQSKAQWISIDEILNDEQLLFPEQIKKLIPNR